MGFNLPDGWKTVRLGEILNFRRGHDLPKTHMQNGIIPVVASNGIIGYHNQYTTQNPCVTIGRSGNVGTPYYYACNCWAHNTTLYIDDYKGNYPKYIYYLLKTLNLNNFRGGSAVPTLNRNHIHPLKIYYTKNTIEQRAIADTLSCLDDKIELNNHMNKTLEEMAQAIFKRWFVEFEFSNEDGQPYKSSGGAMVDSELGEIPQGWRVGSFAEIVSILGGGTPKTGQSEYWNGNIPFFTPKDCTNCYYTLTTEKYLTEKGVVACNSKLYPINTVFITARGTVGKVSLAGRNMAMNQSCYALVGKIECSQMYIHQLTLLIVEKLKSRAMGAVFDAIVTRDFDSLPVCIAPEKFIKNFHHTVISIYEKIAENQKQNQTLTAIRDALLPKLMSGEIRVPLGGDDNGQ